MYTYINKDNLAAQIGEPPLSFNVVASIDELEKLFQPLSAVEEVSPAPNFPTPRPRQTTTEWKTAADKVKQEEEEKARLLLETELKRLEEEIAQSSAIWKNVEQWLSLDEFKSAYKGCVLQSRQVAGSQVCSGA